MSSPTPATSSATPPSTTSRLPTQSAARAPLGIGMVLLAAVLWGTTGTAQSLAPSGLAPVWVGALRLLIAGAFFAALLRWQGGARGLGALPWRGVLAGGVCVAAYNLSFFAGVRASGVALGTAIAIGSGPIWAGLLQTVVQRRWPAAVWWAGTLLGVAGGAAMALDGRTSVQAPPGGIALCLLAGLSYAAYALVNQRLVARAAPGAVNLAVFGSAALLSLPAAFAIAGPLAVSARAWGVVLYLGLVATGLAYLLFTHALRHISGATGVTLALAEPVTAFALAVAVVGESPSAMAVWGLAGVLGGLLIVVWSEIRGRKGAAAG
ncbi:DMT family transporter [Paracidovorax avenae]|uniref:DMT family transporter n=1 Tax=Paracidovorax avenae TaxID=80867 RepID=UPI000D21F3DB|nr:EamA family transporter [Paracidovorax avenae]AVS94870.1 EamA family transporter [Paracidovorax avenae]AVT01213.1 EamA family transporter [Paracidovorax avenae]AVT08287.1 EamA family transporter [Paracidovorax avenae]